MPAKDAPADAPVTVDVLAATSPSLRVPLAGLLAHKPDLASAELTPAKWREALDAYAKTEIKS